MKHLLLATLLMMGVCGCENEYHFDKKGWDREYKEKFIKEHKNRVIKKEYPVELRQVLKYYKNYEFDENGQPVVIGSPNDLFAGSSKAYYYNPAIENRSTEYSRNIKRISDASRDVQPDGTVMVRTIMSGDTTIGFSFSDKQWGSYNEGVLFIPVSRLLG